MATLTTQQKLDQARAARHRILTGTMVRVFVDQNGERVEYSASNIARLESYIAELEAELAGTPSIMIRRPLGYFF
jgi:hypothetical protein